MNWITLAGINGFLAVILGAFGTHGLSSRLSEEGMRIWHVGVQYHLIHAAVLLALALAHHPTHRFRKSLRLILLGEFLFSGSLYILALLSLKSIGYITPVGGLLLLAGWLMISNEGRKSIIKKKS